MKQHFDANILQIALSLSPCDSAGMCPNLLFLLGRLGLIIKYGEIGT